MRLRLGLVSADIETLSLRSGSLQSWATDFGSGNAHSWESTLWKSAIKINFLSGYRLWISGATCWTGGLQSAGLQSRATVFGSMGPLTGLEAYSLGGLQFGGLQLLGLRILVIWDHLTFRKKDYRGPLNVNVVRGIFPKRKRKKRCPANRRRQLR